MPKVCLPSMFPSGNKTVPQPGTITFEPASPSENPKKACICCFDPSEERVPASYRTYILPKNVLQENVVAPSRLLSPRTSVTHYFPVHSVTVSLRFEYISHTNRGLHKFISLSHVKEDWKYTSQN